MRSIWTGSISLGLVNIPVSLHSAVTDSSLDLDMLDEKDHARIRYKRVNEKTGKEVPWNRIVRGYNMNGRYVVLDEKDFERASPEKTKRVDIMNFVEEQEIDSMYFETPYYLVPTDAGAHPYMLLHQAMEKTGRAGIARYVLRNKEHLAVLRPAGKMLLLNTMRFHEEIRPTTTFHIPAKVKLPGKELKMAVNLIKRLTHPFDITRFKDTYSAELLKLIRAKSKGKVPAKRKLKEAPRRVDLMSQLKESLKGGKRKKAA